MAVSGIRVAIITLSTRVSKGERTDLGGETIADFLKDKSMQIVARHVLPDDKNALISRLQDICDRAQADVVLTTGGTGLSPTDVTPEATLAVLEKRLTGFEVAMLMAGMQQTPYAILSRAVAGARNKTIIINLPGNPKGAVENLEAIVQALPHAVRVLQASQVADTEHNAPLGKGHSKTSP